MPLPASFAELAERHRPELFVYLARLLGDQHDAQDACQDALLKAHRAFARLAPDSNCRAWLYRIATNSARDVARRRARRRARTADVDLDTLPTAAAPADDRDRLRAVGRAVERLPRRQREALVLRQFQGCSYDEIAASLGGNAAGARANVYQALKKLRATLGGT